MDKEQPTKQQRKARAELESIAKTYPMYVDLPPNRKWARKIEVLIIKAGYSDTLDAQKKIWAQNRIKKVTPVKKVCPICKSVLDVTEEILDNGCVTRAVSSFCAKCGGVE